MPQSVVDRLHSEFKQVMSRVEISDISSRITLEEIFQKSLLVAAASYFERRVKEDLIEYMDKSSGDVDIVTEFIRNKAIERQYHTLFNWDGQNANSFFGLFGQSFKTYMADYIVDNDEYKAAISAFLELTRERNRIVHQDFGSVSLEKTTDEIFCLYKRALVFVDSITLHFEAYTERKRAGQG